MPDGRWRGGPTSGPWTTARLQRIGNWGRADEALGRHWEDVGLAALTALLAAPRAAGEQEYTPLAVLALAESEALRQEIHTSGLPNPDAALLGQDGDGQGVVQAVDFKWSLERADLPQVSAATLERLLAAPLPGVQALLAEVQASAMLHDTTLARVDGFFFAPEHPENRAWLAGRANASQEFPLTPADVVLWAVEPRAFFGTLPGWELGCWLAEQDRAVRLLDTIEGAERYFRLGAGFGGALVRLATPLFADTPAEIDARAELSALRTRRRLLSSVDLAAWLERQMIAREALGRTLRELEGSVYPFRLFRGELRAQRGAAATDEDGADKRGARDAYKAIRAAVRAELREQGRALTARGQSDAEALATLQARQPELTRQAKGLARRYLATAGDLTVDAASSA